MRRHSTSSLSLSDFTRTLSGLVVTTTIGCAGTVTPPDSTPVYAEEIAPGAEPVDVEMQSTNEPEPKSTTDQSAPTVGDSAEASEVGTAPSGEPSATEPSAKDAPDTSKEEPSSSSAAEKPTPGAPAPTKKPSKKKSSGDEGGCGAGTCG